MDASAPTQPHPTPTRGPGVLGGLGAVATTLLWVAPACLALWLLSSVVVSRAAGYELARLDAASPVLFAEGWRWALRGLTFLVVGGLVAGLKVGWARWVQKEEHDESVWLALWITFGALTLALIVASVLCDHFGVAEGVEPIGWIVLWLWTLAVFPVWLLWQCFVFLRWAWREAAHRHTVRGAVVAAALLGVVDWTWFYLGSDVVSDAMGIELPESLPAVDSWFDRLDAGVKRELAISGSRQGLAPTARAVLLQLGRNAESTSQPHPPVPVAAMVAGSSGTLRDVGPTEGRRGGAAGSGGGGSGSGGSPQDCMERVVSSPPDPSLLEEGVSYLRRHDRLTDARDLTHDTVLNVCLTKPELQGERLRRYFFAALKGNLKATARRQRTFRRCELDVRTGEEFRRVSVLTGDFDRAIDARRAFCRLGADDQRALELRYGEGRSHEDAAAKMGVKPAAFRQRVGRAVAKLQADF